MLDVVTSKVGEFAASVVAMATDALPGAKRPARAPAKEKTAALAKAKSVAKKPAVKKPAAKVAVKPVESDRRHMKEKPFEPPRLKERQSILNECRGLKLARSSG
jgi:hypothetical protein